ncbi:ATP-binding protein [Streptomyces sp. NPDC057654]|uniref:ATP-binding protein n=1 Tax=Streptomyces sp. NPDC057654 TaxID=3346196 RepID=UPI0036803C19
MRTPNETLKPAEPPNPHEPWSYGLFIPHDPRAVGIVRATVRAILKAARLHCVIDTAELLVSELATNAYRYSKTDAYVSVDWIPHDLHVAVWDTGTGLPQRHAPTGEDEHGRGLGLVQTVADSWGVQSRAGDPDSPGKAVWFILRT